MEHVAAASNGDAARRSPDEPGDQRQVPEPRTGYAPGGVARGQGSDSAAAEEFSRALGPLWVRFCEELIGDALVRTSKNGAVPENPERVDWQGIWASGRDLPPDEAVGRVVMVSYRVAGEILGSRPTSPPQGVIPALPGVGWAPSPTAAPPAPPAAAAPARLLPPPPPPTVQRPAPATMVPRAAPARPLPPPPTAAKMAVLAGSSPPPAAVVHAPSGLPAYASPEPPVARERESTLAVTAEREPKQRDNVRLVRRLFVAAGWVRNVGVILILFAAWQIWGTSIEHDYAQQTLRTEFEVHVHHVVTTPAAPALISSNARLSEPPEGSVVGHLQIPTIGVDQYVVEGTAEGDLAKGPGHYVGTSMPGQAGNVAIAGHRTTYGAPFNNLNELKVDDRITLTTLSGAVLTYVVSQPPVAVSPNDVAVLNSGNDNRLTLTTCNPKFSASQRLVVVALLSQPEAAAATTVTVTPHKVRVASDPIGWNVDYLPEVVAVLVILVLLGIFNGRARKAYGRLGRALVLTPVWIAGLFFLFEALTKLLPANL